MGIFGVVEDCWIVGIEFNGLGEEGWLDVWQIDGLAG